MVGLLPLAATTTLGAATLDRLPWFAGHLRWFVANEPGLARVVVRRPRTRRLERPAAVDRRPRAAAPTSWRRCSTRPSSSPPTGCARCPGRHRGTAVRACSSAATVATVGYEPGESGSGLFGGNSNWRGPVWFPVNYLLVEALRRFARFFGDDLVVEHPTGSGKLLPLDEVADDLAERLIGIFPATLSGRRAVFGDLSRCSRSDPDWHDLVAFHEYFHGDTGQGLGASHQTGWTGLVADLILRRHRPRR